MHDTVDPGGDFFHLPVVGEVGGDKLLVRREVRGFSDIAYTNAWISPFKQLAQARADVAGSAGDQDMHFSFPGYSRLNIINREGR